MLIASPGWRPPLFGGTVLAPGPGLCDGGISRPGSPLAFVPADDASTPTASTLDDCRRGWDANPRAGFCPPRFSKPAPWTARPPLRIRPPYPNAPGEALQGELWRLRGPATARARARGRS